MKTQPVVPRKLQDNKRKDPRILTLKCVLQLEPLYLPLFVRLTAKGNKLFRQEP